MIQSFNPVKARTLPVPCQHIDLFSVDYLKKGASQLNSTQGKQSHSFRKRSMQSLNTKVLKQAYFPKDKLQASCSHIKSEISPITSQFSPFVSSTKVIVHEQTKDQRFSDDNSTQSEIKSPRSHPFRNSTQSEKCLRSKTKMLSSGVTNYSFPIWENKDSLCWLDSTLSLLVHCEKLNAYFEGVTSDTCHLKEVFVAYRKAFNVLNSVENETQKNSVRACNLTSNVCKKLEIARDQVFSALQPELQCKKGDEESPIFALPIILKKSNFIDKFLMDFAWKLKCQVCGHCRTTCNQKPIITFPNTPCNFSVDKPYFLTPCFNCKAPDQHMYLQLAYLPDIMLFHFMQGLPHSNIPRYDIKHLGKSHRVTGIIQYCENIRHFIAWIRNPKDESWLCCDDLKTSPQQFLPNLPKIPPSEIHILMWQLDSAELPDSMSAQKCCFVKNVVLSNDKESSASHPVFTIDDCNIPPMQNLDRMQDRTKTEKEKKRSEKDRKLGKHDSSKVTKRTKLKIPLNKIKIFTSKSSNGLYLKK